MNLKKAALLIILCVAAFPAVGNTKSVQDNNRNVYCAKRKTVGNFFIHLLTLGHRGQ